MPIYEYKCSNCGRKIEVIRYDLNSEVCKCGTDMEMRFFPAMIKIKGEGGYPSRRKQIRNTTYQNHPKLEHEVNRVYI
ncbi:hypothetical protein LCGC14_2201850 [marine sediment metagenome]|uniref:Putative regulatory protein FmdB zinc ribbon domain-containing protein n=1 Tax=marine sediment metagenome TaxID=412755 RepID=A0A0F9E3T1_9ZZZZ